MKTYTLSDFDYELPEKLIAQHPPAERGASRLLDVRTPLVDRKFSDLPLLLRAGDLLVFNDTKVIPARLFATKETGGKVEIMIERVLTERTALAQIRASKTPQAGALLHVAEGFAPQVLSRKEPFYLLQFPEGKSVVQWLDLHGALPLPPYITHVAQEEDDARYQTVYAKHSGAVAAPTAGLHFTETMLSKLSVMGVEIAHVTLHVGAGTFKPVRHEKLADHDMHSEWYTIAPQVSEAVNRAKKEGRRVIAVGTTSLRALESAAPKIGEITCGANDTKLFITPGYQFKIVDAMTTNFHLPKSTLMMLVSAFAGYDEIRAAYAHAIAQDYRFFSYGDAMFLQRKE